MSTPIQSLNLSVRAEKCLLAKGLKTVEELSFYFGEHGMVGLLKIPNLGRRWSHEVADRVNAWMVGALDKNDPEPKPLMASDATLRDYFATKAMTVGYERYWRGVDQMEADGITVTVPDDWRDVIATNAYRLADAMLRAREAAP